MEPASLANAGPACPSPATPKSKTPPPAAGGPALWSPHLGGGRGNRVANRPLVYVTRRIPQKGMDILLGACDVKQWDAEEPVPRGELLYSVRGAHGILCMQGDTVDADVISAAGPNLQVVATTASATCCHIDVAECDARGIQVLTLPDQPTETLADLTVALVLLTIKETLTEEERLINFDLIAPDVIPDNKRVSTGSLSPIEILTNLRTQSRPRFIQQMSEERLAFQWNNGKPGNTTSSTWRNIVKKRFGIYGLTKLGLSVAKLLNSLGVSDVMLSDRSWEQDVTSMPSVPSSSFKMVAFDELLQKSDVICLCDNTSLSDSASVADCQDNEDSVEDRSQVVFCQKAFEKMNSDSILVAPTSRQPAVDYVDLYAALRLGQIRAAGLNDCNQEPVPLKAPLLGLNNCVFLPQTQEAVYDMRHKVSVTIAKELTEALSLSREKSFSM